MPGHGRRPTSWSTSPCVDGVATITLDSPANRNALSTRLVADLNTALDVAEAGVADGRCGRSC